jgi:hypothetical protein
MLDSTELFLKRRINLVRLLHAKTRLALGPTLHVAIVSDGKPNRADGEGGTKIEPRPCVKTH